MTVASAGALSIGRELIEPQDPSGPVSGGQLQRRANRHVPEMQPESYIRVDIEL